MQCFKKIEPSVYADSQHIYAEYLVLQALLFRDQYYFTYASQASDPLKIVGKNNFAEASHCCRPPPAPWATLATVTS